MNAFKFLFNGIRFNGKVATAWYSENTDGSIDISARHYAALPRIDGLVVTNGTDIMTDYFERDRIRVGKDNPHYPAVLEAMQAQKAYQKRVAERREKHYAAKRAVQEVTR